MESTSTVRTVRLHRALALGLFGAGVVTVLALFGGGSEAHADALPVADDLLGSLGTVVDTVQAPVTAVTTVVTEAVAPVAEVADTVVAQVPVVNTVVESTVGAAPVSGVVAVISGTVTGTVGGVTTVIDHVTGAVIPALPSHPGIPVPGGPDVDGLVTSGVAVSTSWVGSLPAVTDIGVLISDSVSGPVEAAATASTPGPVGTAGSAIPPLALAPGSGGSSVGSGGSAGGINAAESSATDLAFVLPVTGRESARDDDLPPSPCSEFDTSPD